MKKWASVWQIKEEMDGQHSAMDCFPMKKKKNLKFVVEAVGKSVDQVFQAYNYPSRDLNTAVVTDIIPILDEESKNHALLFQVKDGKVYSRSMLSFFKQKVAATKRKDAVTSLKKRS